MDSSEPIIDLDNISETDNQDEEHVIPIPLTSAKSSPLKTLHIEYVDDLPEYPTTHIQGYAYVVASGGRSQAEMEQVVQEIQYARKLTQGRKRPVYSPFLLCHAQKWTWRCSGVYICEYLSPTLLPCYHTSVNEATWYKIQESQRQIQASETDTAKRNAYSLYRSKVKFFARGHACIDQLPTCKPVFRRYTQPTVLGEYRPYIGCINGTPGLLNKHHQGEIQGHTVLDLQFLEDLFNKEILPSTEECGVFEPLASRRKFCERDHPQGPGRLKHITCEVIFNALVPVDINQRPYILFTSHGIHKHPPPPPTKSPERILHGIENIIQEIRDPTITTARFLQTPQLEAFCRQYNALTLAEIHSSFCNKDRITAIIEKQRMLSYPNGQDLNGLRFLQQIDQHMKDYIQEVYHDSNGTMILCAFKQQIQLLAKLSSFEVDMSYKRVRSKGMNEVLFATFLPDQCKIITLLRVFTDQDSTYGYYLLFKRVFTLINKISQQPILLDPIHGTGIYGIIVDMDSKQYSGLGQYLSEIDPQHRDPVWQLEHIIIFCRVHFQRSILKAIGTRHRGSPLWSLMMDLFNCSSEAEYDELLRLLIERETKTVQDWAVQKKSSIIKAGLNQACSKIQPHYFQILRNHTNAVEQSHQKSNAAGKYLNLIEAVKSSAKLDQDDILQYNNFTKFNIHHSYRTSNMEANYIRHMSRERSRKRQRSISSSTSESQRDIQPRQNTPRSNSQSSHSRNSDNNSVQSSQDLRRVASANILSLDQRRQDLELRRLEIELQQAEANIKQQNANIEHQKEQTRLQQLENEEKELDLIERRMRIRENSEAVSK